MRATKVEHASLTPSERILYSQTFAQTIAFLGKTLVFNFVLTKFLFDRQVWNDQLESSDVQAEYRWPEISCQFSQTRK